MAALLGMALVWLVGLAETLTQRRMGAQPEGAR